MRTVEKYQCDIFNFFCLMKYALLILCLYTSTIVIKDFLNKPTNSVSKTYTHIKKGMEKAFVDFLFPDDNVYVGDELIQYQEHKQRMFSPIKKKRTR